VLFRSMLSYGVDRTKILKEMMRVLAPGGTLFLTETTANIKKYPNLLAELQKVVPTVDTLEDPVGFYTNLLGEFEISESKARTYFDHRLCATLLAQLHRGEVLNKLTDEKRKSHEDGLLAIAGLLADELGRPSDNGQGWQVAVRATKVGALRPELVVPKPICLSCRSEIRTTLDSCDCTNCGAQYRTEWGVPYILSDFTKVYSPKDKADSNSDFKNAATRWIKALPDGLGSGPFDEIRQFFKLHRGSVCIIGIDKSTRYLIRHLTESGFLVSRIYSDTAIFENCE